MECKSWNVFTGVLAALLLASNLAHAQPPPERVDDPREMSIADYEPYDATPNALYALFQANSVKHANGEIDITGVFGVANGVPRVLMPGDPRLEGTYRGRPGFFQCAGPEPCEVRVNLRHSYSWPYRYRRMTGEWLFVPLDIVERDRGDYSYGARVDRTAPDFANQPEEMSWFTAPTGLGTYATSPVAETGDVSAVSGTAYYRGDAGGLYMRDGRRGEFTADAELEVDFDTLDRVEVYGYIDRFKLDGKLHYGWAVDLWPDKFNRESGVLSGTVSGMTNGWGGDEDGLYEAKFRGTTTPLMGDTEHQPPALVVGEFNANFLDGWVAGGFGVRTPLRDGTMGDAIGETRIDHPTGNGKKWLQPIQGHMEPTYTVDERGNTVERHRFALAAPSAGYGSDHMQYGYWQDRTMLPDGRDFYSPVHFFVGNDKLDNSAVPAGQVQGTASYSGGAGGVYERDGIAGTFTGDAELEARFGTLAISGDITGIELSEHDVSDWSVRLRASAIQPNGQFGVGGSAIGEVHGRRVFTVPAGSYRGQLYGDTSEGVAPDAAGGTFRAGFEDGSIAGAFGVRKDD